MEKVPFTFGLLETEAFVVTIAIAMDTLQVFTQYQLVSVKYKICTILNLTESTLNLENRQRIFSRKVHVVR